MFKLIVALCLIVATIALVNLTDNYSYSLLTEEEKAQYQAEQTALAEQKAILDAEIKSQQLQLKNKAYKDVSSDELAEWFALNFSEFIFWFGLGVGFIIAAKVYYKIAKPAHPF